MAGQNRFYFNQFTTEDYKIQVRHLLIREAAQYQREVADYITTHKLRPKESTGSKRNRLTTVTRSPGNREVTATTWRVGIPGYLNRSEAKYWRLIEQGSAGLYARGRGFRGTPLMVGPPGTFTRGGTSAKSSWGPGRSFRSFKNKNMRDDNYRAAFYARNPKRMRGVRVVTVQNEIRGMNAYRTVFKDNKWQERIKRDFEQSVRKSFLR